MEHGADEACAILIFFLHRWLGSTGSGLKGPTRPSQNPLCCISSKLMFHLTNVVTSEDIQRST